MFMPLTWVPPSRRADGTRLKPAPCGEAAAALFGCEDTGGHLRGFMLISRCALAPPDGDQYKSLAKENPAEIEVIARFAGAIEGGVGDSGRKPTYSETMLAEYFAGFGTPILRRNPAKCLGCQWEGDFSFPIRSPRIRSVENH